MVTKIPRWAFEKLPGAEARLGTRMQSVGEVMAIGRTFPESLQKALRGLEQGRAGLNADQGEAALDVAVDDELLERVAVADPRAPLRGRGRCCAAACRSRTSQRRRASTRGSSARSPGSSRRDAASRTASSSGAGDPGAALADLGARGLAPSRSGSGFSDAQIAYLLGVDEAEVARREAGGRRRAHVQDGRHLRCGVRGRDALLLRDLRGRGRGRGPGRPRVVILGSGPNRIGQGIEFDYCCVHASMALREAGYETVMVNCNPETVSTDYDTSDRLYFEPLTAEDVQNVLDSERRASVDGGRLAGVIVGLGGQTPLKLAHAIDADLVLGTSPESIDCGRRPASVGARCAGTSGSVSPPEGRRPRPRRRSRSRPRSATPCSSVRATCSAAGPWRSSTTTRCWAT